MPRGDGTGPMGTGPMTGRAAGYCAGSPTAGFMNPGPRSGYGAGGRGQARGRGRGRQNWFHATGLPGWQRAAGGWPAFGAGGGYGAPYAAPFAPPTPSGEQELDTLKSQAESLASTLEDIKQRIAELEAQPQKKD